MKDFDKRRMYSLLHYKAVDDGEQRVIEGIATTPTTDRVGDIVDPMGAKFGEEIPLNLYHDNTLPVGQVRFGRPTKKGIPFKATLPKVQEAGVVRDRVDEAWHSVKYNLLRAVSIGFRVMWEMGEDAVQLLEGGGLKFLKTEILELSLVGVPANPDAVITGIKSLDDELRATSGRTARRIVTVTRTPAGVPAQRPTIEERGMFNISEEIKTFGSKRAASTARMLALMEAASKDGRNLNEQEDQEYKDLEAEVTSIDEHLTRLKGLQAIQAKVAVPVTVNPGEDPEDGAMRARNGVRSAVQVDKKLEPGIEFARFAMALGAAKGMLPTAYAIARTRFKDTPRVINVLKSAVDAGTTTDLAWAGALLEYTQFTGDFIEFLRPMTILGKFGANGVPSLRQVPFNVNIRAQTSGGNGYWVGQGKAKPLTAFEFENIYLGFTKVANIAVLTEELLRFSNPSAERLVRDALAAALIERLDIDFVDPDKAEQANVSPASITYGVVPLPSTGTDADAIRADVKAAMGAFIASNMSLANGVWIMPATTALSLSLVMNALGQREFPDVTMTGGRFLGLPVIVSEYIQSDSDGKNVILASASDIYLADDGQVTIDASREASLEMEDGPSGDATNGTGAQLVSMFQTNSVALRAERYVNWKKRRDDAVVLLTEVEWGSEA